MTFTDFMILLLPLGLALAPVLFAVWCREPATVEDAYREGLRAGVRYLDNGVIELTCPYHRGTLAFTAWTSGALDVLRMANRSGADMARKCAQRMGA